MLFPLEPQERGVGSRIIQRLGIDTIATAPVLRYRTVMNVRTHLFVTTAPMAAIGYASAPPDTRAPQRVDEFEKRDPDSQFMLPYWEKVDAVMDGIDGMKLRDDEFLPRFRDEHADDYKFRQTCAKFTNVYSDIAEGLASKPFEQAVQLIEDEADAARAKTRTPKTPIPEAIRQFQWDVDGSGNNLTVFAAHTFLQGINNAIDWILIDYDKRDPRVRSMADAKRAGRRPYWSHILARNVLSAQSRMIGGDEVITYVKIFEPGSPDHIREFERGVDGNVTWRLWEKRTSPRTEYVMIDTGDISIGIIPMVPFVTGRREGRRWRFTPPMRAAVETAVNLFKQETELEYKSTMSAYSMLAGNGIERPSGPDGKPTSKLLVGPSKVLWSPPRSDGGPAGRWEWIEPSAEILKFLADRVDNTIQQLRELGRQPLTASSSNITVITAAVAAGKAKSAVKAWAYKLSDTLENALKITAMWMAVEYDPTVHVFAEFDDWMEGEDIDALLKMHERNAISTQTLHEEMQRRGVLSSNFTNERETLRLLEDLPRDSAEIDDGETR